MESSTPTHLNPSELGTKKYWDDSYHEDIHGSPSRCKPLHPGWFSEANAADKMVEYLSSPELSLDKKTTSFLDLGTGSGELLFLLDQEWDFEGPMLGVDYSQNSIELAKMWGGDGFPSERTQENQIRFEVHDIMEEKILEVGEGYDVVLDKGTFDAISLSAEKDEQGRRICEGYRERVERLVKYGGLLLVTSCNWTEEELKKWFEGGSLKPAGRIKYPTFKFGGKTGQSVCSICFRRDNQVL